MKEYLQKIKDSLKKDTIIKIAALFFAFILWNYVLSDTNPQRSKTVRNLSVIVLNQDTLSNEKLMVTDGLADLVNSVSVTVSVEKNYLDYVTADNVSAEVDLANIKEPGTYELNLKAKTAYGSIANISPSSISIVVDTVTQSTIPIECRFTGEDKSDVYVSTPTLSKSEINISGPSSILSNITKAVCYLDRDKLEISDKKQSATLQLYFIGEDGNALDQTTVQKYISADYYSVIASYDVKSKKTVPVDISSSILNQDKVKAGYEMQSATVDPSNVTIVGDAAVLNTVNSLKVKSVSISGLSSNTTKSSTLIVPSKATVLEGNTVNINIVIQPKSS